MKLLSPLSERSGWWVAFVLVLFGTFGLAAAQEIRPRRVTEKETFSNAEAERALEDADSDNPEMCLYLNMAGPGNPLQAKREELNELFSAHGIRGVASAGGVYTASLRSAGKVRQRDLRAARDYCRRPACLAFGDTGLCHRRTLQRHVSRSRHGRRH
jgi:hypothetical protein